MTARPAALENTLRARIPKLGEFLTRGPFDLYETFASPWDVPGTPYYVEKEAGNQDGRGGYSGRHAFDAEGVPFTPSAGGRHYHPLVVARYALRMLQVARQSGDAGAGERGREVLPALVESGRGTAAWGPGSDARSMSARRPSSLVQGVVLSALARLCAGRPEPALAELMARAVDRLLLPVEEGGAASRLSGGFFLEEAPATGVRQILNGCLYGLFGLYDAARILGHPGAARAAAGIEQTLVRNVRLFTAPLGWSYYCLDAYGSRYLARRHYHASHILQVQVVARRLDSAGLAGEAEWWHAAMISTPRRMLCGAAKTMQAIWMRDVRRLRLDVCP